MDIYGFWKSVIGQDEQKIRAYNREASHERGMESVWCADIL